MNLKHSFAFIALSSLFLFRGPLHPAANAQTTQTTTNAQTDNNHRSTGKEPDDSIRRAAEKTRKYMEEINSGPVPYGNMREALAVIQKSTDAFQVRKTYDFLPRVPVRDRDDLMALYDAARKAPENVPLAAGRKAIEKRGLEANQLSERLGKCTDPALQVDIGALLDKEYSSLESDSRLPLPATPRGTMKAIARTERVKALIQAAGDGKNAKARDPLWKLIDLRHDDYFAQLSVLALGKIGNPDDLDRLLAMKIKNPKLHLSLGSFGTLVLPRVMKQLDAPGISPELRGKLLLDLREAGSQGNASAYVPLLQSKDKAVADAAADALERGLRVGDDDVIKTQLKNPSWYVRSGVIIAIGNHAWSEKYVPLLIDVLRHDLDEDNRKLAADYLGDHKAQSSVPALQEALKDRSARVRLSASVAIEEITGKAP